MHIYYELQGPLSISWIKWSIYNIMNLGLMEQVVTTVKCTMLTDGCGNYTLITQLKTVSWQRTHACVMTNTHHAFRQRDLIALHTTDAQGLRFPRYICMSAVYKFNLPEVFSLNISAQHTVSWFTDNFSPFRILSFNWNWQHGGIAFCQMILQGPLVYDLILFPAWINNHMPCKV